ncbi:hypothetical protein PAECIP111890_00157 [Paenibacillus sp. JJ-223]|nr:hypothetical protein PAECIP111890_00157 [Paenibacillus sp. JJ-223]
MLIQKVLSIRSEVKGMLRQRQLVGYLVVASGDIHKQLGFQVS